jgi:thiamine-phosphate pyrophosphorylase
VITDRGRFPAAPPGEPFSAEEWAALDAVIAARPGALQLRDKDLDGGARYRRAERLAARCRQAGVKLLVNDRADVALACGADGVHLPEAGLPPRAVRELLPAGAIVGRSLHAAAGLAASDGADFVLFGPVYDTPSKRAFAPPQGTARLAEVCCAASLPVLAVGGVTPERVAELRAAGAAGVAVIGAVLGAADPGAAVRRLLDALA